ncbi:uncharacterized protein SPPG_06459 [Spizellomyces punctatus DAOM BR117]|uniref:Reelin domain-containing protein n=1 Tax=Spizellomyces punctatus (strain DAOM BR117) TaxID=645134 RepID=A0A0L0H936_SPIPD|nr:uncharacterized protein SPPG_06459 [Spizellomyces punctatus DAOM BR117]KNC98045.1 hypothetical protein SPPG_06459 [Spizellomyces punctatus DAOM BR117]|eukprot:XP_016606085.1 hypothetical protein SPPG_06459 [Spizellomyces punctatus DAOM BR117]
MTPFVTHRHRSNMQYTVLVLALVALLPFTTSYPTSAGTCIASPDPIAAVGAMGTLAPTLPITLTATQTNTSTTVTLNGTGTFAGLLLYAAPTIDAQQHVGTWKVDNALYKTLDGGPETLDCTGFGRSSTLSHASPAPKNFPVEFTLEGAAGVKVWGVVVVSAEVGFRAVESGVV